MASKRESVQEQSLGMSETKGWEDSGLRCLGRRRDHMKVAPIALSIITSPKCVENKISVRRFASG